MNRKELAYKLHHQGFNCAQALACSYCNVLGFDPETVFRMMEAFGFGMGCMDTCGAVTGMAAVIGMKTSDGNMDKPGTKRECYALMRQAHDEFLSMNGSVICREIKGVDTGKVLRSCDGCIEDAVTILDKLLLGIED